MPKLNTEALRALIFANGMSVTDAAREFHMSRSLLSNVINGRGGVGPKTVKRMSEVLKVPMVVLVNIPVDAEVSA